MDPQIKDNVKEQLLLLRGLTKTTGVLHEAQVLQLKLWPLMLFEFATGSEFHFGHDKREIDFVIKAKGKIGDIQDKCELLDGWAKWLLGEDYLVRVRNGKDNKVLFRGMRKSQPPPVPNPQYDVSGFENRVKKQNFENEFKRLQSLEENEG